MTRFREIIRNAGEKVGLGQRVELEMGEFGAGSLCKEKLILEGLVAATHSWRCFSQSIFIQPLK